MKCITIDDELNALSLINNYIKKIDFLELVGSFQDPVKAIQFYQENEVDLIFLDINMPDLNGLQFLKSLTKDPLVIFTTAYCEYALDSFDYNVIDYLLKPIEFDRFIKSVNKLRKTHKKESKSQKKGIPQQTKGDDCIFIKSSGVNYKVLINEILYIKSLGNYISIVTTNNKITSYYSMSEILNILPKNQFLRIHKSFIISLQHIQSYEKHQVKLNEEKIPIGTTYRKLFAERIQGN